MKQPILTDTELARIGRDLVQDAGGADPMHPKLWKEIDKAMFVACNSETFRKIVARETEGK